MIDGEERLNIVNNKPRTFTNVKVSSIDNWINPADAEYNNLCIENFGEDKQNLGKFFNCVYLVRIFFKTPTLIINAN